MFRDKEILNQVMKQEIMLSRMMGTMEGMLESIKYRFSDIEGEIKSSHEIQEEGRITEEKMKELIKESIKTYLDETYLNYLKEAQKKQNSIVKNIPTIKKLIKK